ncbi:hypothetical protein [Fonticella tunisiensis]|uniref:Uncharacterized protein n=1 Tax=Fonticella tunisiensis TaxID=1096341 RepID=A0A4V3ES02_9CLOT|nr:hypothetical protein [Fonticella tunisiensis]TDT50807.1 hypothetical protein EDD71_12420 [Fonticella tunisiensis]
MSKLYYCTRCKRVVKSDLSCDFCKNETLKELVAGAPVNVIGSKLKGKVLKIKDGVVRLLIRDESNNKFIREYEAEKVRKIL